MFLNYLPPDLLREHRIADFGGNVYILYVAEMPRDSRFLLLTCNLGYPEKRNITICNLQFGRIEGYDK